MKFSIVIPTYEYKGLTPVLLNKLLGSISEQTFTDYEIIVSDHSKSDLVKNFLNEKWLNPLNDHKVNMPKVTQIVNKIRNKTPYKRL